MPKRDKIFDFCEIIKKSAGIIRYYVENIHSFFVINFPFIFPLRSSFTESRYKKLLSTALTLYQTAPFQLTYNKFLPIL